MADQHADDQNSLNTRFCHRELARFDQGNFTAARGGWVHKVNPAHFNNGTPTKTVPGFPGVLGALVGSDIEKRQEEADNAAISGEWTNEYAQQQAIYNAYIEVTKSSIDRAQARGEFVEKAAGTIATAYTAILALSFSVKDFRLPLQGVIPVLFLGLAVLLAALYLGYITPRPSKRVSVGAPTLYEVQRLRLVAFMEWALRYVYDRRYLLHMSLVSLGAGVVLLPAAYLSTGSPGNILMWVFAGAAFVLVFVLPLGVDWLLAGRRSDPEDLSTPNDEA